MKMSNPVHCELWRGSQMSTIVHAREGGGLRNVHMDKIFGKMQSFAASDISR